MAAKHPKSGAAFTLVEAMMAVVVLAVAALGALSHQYHTAGHVRIAKAQTTATHTARLLLEDWKAANGSANYDPATTLGLGFSTSSVGPEDVEFVMAHNQKGSMLNGMLLEATINDVQMKILLAWKDIDTGGSMQLKQISVIIKWADSSDITPVILTTYVRIDISSG